MDPKLLSEQGWKAIASKQKIKDNGLLKALSDYQKLAEDEYDGRLVAVTLVSKMAAALKKDKQVAANPAVVKYLADLADCAEAKRNEIIKAKALAEKSESEAKKREQKTVKSGHEDDQNEEEETGDVIVRLKRALQSLKNSKEAFYFLACDAKPYGLIISRKNIKSSAQHKKELATLAGGSTRPPRFGTCRRDGNNLMFDMETPTPGLARILQKWIKSNTGLPLKITVGDESAEDEDGIAQAEEGHLPPVPPALEKAPDLWLQTRREIGASIDGLKDAIQKQFAEEGPGPIAEMEENLKKLDRVFDTLDDKLANALAKARLAKDGASRQTELNNAKSLLAYYIKYVKAEPLIAHIDANPFGVKTNLKQKLAETLTQVARAI